MLHHVTIVIVVRGGDGGAKKSIRQAWRLMAGFSSGVVAGTRAREGLFFVPEGLRMAPRVARSFLANGGRRAQTLTSCVTSGVECFRDPACSERTKMRPWAQFAGLSCRTEGSS
jgi:hypothetical protein